MKKTYILTSKKIDGPIRITFENGIFNAIQMEIKEPLSYKQFEALINYLPYEESSVGCYRELKFEVVLEAATNQKIALFCRFYEERTKAKYKVSAADSGKMKGIQITEDMLKHYFFTSTNFIFLNKYSIANLVKYYNELNAEIACLGQSSHPAHYNKEYESKLKPDEMSSYWKHLRGLGLHPKKDRVGNVIDWV